MSKLNRLGATLLDGADTLELHYERGPTHEGVSRMRLEYTISGWVGGPLAGSAMMDLAIHEISQTDDDPDDDDGERKQVA